MVPEPPCFSTACGRTISYILRSNRHTLVVGMNDETTIATAVRVARRGRAQGRGCHVIMYSLPMFVRYFVRDRVLYLPGPSPCFVMWFFLHSYVALNAASSRVRAPFYYHPDVCCVRYPCANKTFRLSCSSVNEVTAKKFGHTSRPRIFFLHGDKESDVIFDLNGI